MAGHLEVDDPDLELAIRLSKEQHQAMISVTESSRSGKGKRKAVDQEIIVIDDDDDDGDEIQEMGEAEFQRQMAKAMEESMKGVSTNGSIQAEASGVSCTAEASSSAPTFLRERAQLEKERLARKRARDGALGIREDDVGGTSQAPLPDKKPRIATLSSLNPIGSSGNSNRPVIAALGPATGQGSVRYWGGAVKVTPSSLNASRDGRNETLSIQDILSANSKLQYALLSAFCVDTEWIYAQFPRGLDIALVMHHSERTGVNVSPEFPNLYVIKPEIPSNKRYCCMHIKFIILPYADFLRVVIPTANLLEYDWHLIENAIWIQDFPSLAEGSASFSTSPFRSTLSGLLSRLGVPSRFRSFLSRYDFSAADDPISGVRLVPSVSGSWTGWSDISNAGSGHPELGKALCELNCRPAKDMMLQLECQGSSIGDYKEDWLQEFYLSAQGVKPGPERHQANTRTPWSGSKRGKGAVTGYKKSSPLPIQILFPTWRTAEESTLGANGAGTLFCQYRTWTAPTFPKSMMRDGLSRRKGVMMHMILGLYKPAKSAGSSNSSTDDDTTTEEEDGVAITSSSTDPGGFTYVGSHNFTQGAWGKLTYKGKTPTLDVSNFELGVVFALRGKDGADVERRASELATWVRPTTKYRRDDEPWQQFSHGKGIVPLYRRNLKGSGAGTS